MGTEMLLAIAEELKTDYQIPPYVPDEVVERAVQFCAARLCNLKPGADFEKDIIGRAYLKSYSYYELMHRGEEFLQNYGPDIRAWQLSEEVEDEA